MLSRSFHFLLAILCMAQQAKLNSIANDANNPNQFTDPCALIRCSPHEICVANYSKKATCIARKTVMLDESNPVNSVKGTSSRDPSLRVDVSKRHSDAPHFRVSCGANECRFGECEMRNETQFVCHCFKGVTGDSCNNLDTSGMPCASNPCYGNSYCINRGDFFICACDKGRIGPQCIDKLGSCDCRNGGTCLQQLAGSFRCRCTEDFGGPNCEFKIKSSDRVGILHSTKPPSAYSAMTHVKKHPKALSDIEICTHNICLNGGTCLQVDSSSTVCLCQYRYNGPFCELEIKPMSTVPVFQPQLSPGPIMVTRLITVKTRVGLMGNVVSQTAKLPCFWNVPNPCLNGGKCMFLGDEITCDCAPSYTGTFCTEFKDFCFHETCYNGGECDHVGNRCVCTPNFTGKFCEFSVPKSARRLS